MQTILIENGVGTKYERLSKLEERMATEPIELTAEQVRLIEKSNPAFRERHVESSRPGELLAQDTFYVGTFKGLGKLYMQAVVDTFGSYAFATLHTSKRPKTAALLLHNEVLPFYADRQIKVDAVLTDHGREFRGTPHHPFEPHLAFRTAPGLSNRTWPFEPYLALNDPRVGARGQAIEHRRTRVRRPQTNGFVEPFNRTVLDEFFRTDLRDAVFDRLDDLQARLDAWLVHYNQERPHRGYRNMGRRPIETIDQASTNVRQEG